jgi:ubiquinone/menaquinone biosynthesis C-methylase UbiE
MADLMYGPDGPAERDVHLVGHVEGKRVLDLGCGDGAAAVTLAQQGAVVIAVDAVEARLQRASKRAEEQDVRLEWRTSDLADLAFLRADSIDLVFSAYAVDTVDDIARLFRQVQRVLKPNAPFVFSHAHPFTLHTDGGRPPRAYFDAAPLTTNRDGQPTTLYPKTLSDTFTNLARAGFRVDALLESPATVVWRARKEGT